MKRTALPLIALLALAACNHDGEEPAETTTSAAAEQQAAAAPADPAPGAATGLPQPGTGAAPAQPVDPSQVPQIYVALQGQTGRPVSVIFAIDESRDGTPSDDPAMRITPENGECNPQEMRNHDFGDGTAPTFGPREVEAGITALQLPSYLAISVTETMLSQGLAATREETAPQNVCTRKLWERIMIAEAQKAQQAAGQ